MKHNSNEIIEKLNQEWTSALVNNNAQPLQRILSDDFVIQGTSDKHVSKSSYLNFVKSSKAKFEEGNIIKTLIKDNIAIVVGKSTLRSGDSSTGDYIYTNVFEKRGEEWYGIASQSVKL